MTDPTVVAIGNQKGGVGKTSTTLGLASALAETGRRVLVVDLDPQADATRTLDASGDLEIVDVLMADKPGLIGQAIVESAWAGIDVVPSSRRLAAFENQGGISGAEHRLFEAMYGADLSAYDHVLIDLSPSLGRLPLNGLIAAHKVLVVTETSTFSVAAVPKFVDTVREVQARPTLNPRLAFEGIVVNKYDQRNAEDKYQLAALQDAYGDLVLMPVLPLRSAVKDVASFHKPVGEGGTSAARTVAQLYAAHATRLTGKIEEAA